MELNAELLGEELYNQVQEKLGDKKAVILDAGQEIYNPKDGLFFPKAKWDEVNTSKNHLQTELDTLQTELAALKETAGSKADYEKKLGELQAKMDEKKLSFEAVELENRKGFALALHLRDAEANSPELLENQFKTDGKWSFELDTSGDIDRIKDWDNTLKPVKDKYPPQFGVTKKVGYDPKKPKTNNEEFFSQEEMDAFGDNEFADNLPKIKESVEYLKQG